MKFAKWAAPAAAVVVAGSLLTACGGESAKQNAAADSARKKTAEPSPQDDAVSLETTNDAKLGKVVVDGDGRTLYRFDKDTAKPPASNCKADCLEAWPPVTSTQEDVEVNGLNAKMVGKLKRPDGTWQVTLGGWPLYRYAKDQGAGDTRGQGVGGVWYAAAPNGKKAERAAARPPQAGAGQQGGGRWAGWTTIKVRQDPKLGMIVTNGKGRTMYRFDKDRPRVTNCFGDCRRKWPIVPFNGWKKLKVEGVDRDKIGFIERKDGPPGQCQLLINKWPMYYFAKDTRPGDTNGQGAMNIWWVVSPQGAKITAGAGAQGGGYGGGY